MYISVAGLQFSSSGRNVSDSGPTVQTDRLHRQLLHPAGRDAADVRAHGQTVGRAATKSRRLRHGMVERLAGRSALVRQVPHNICTTN